MIFFLQNTPIFTSLISSHSIFKICERQDNLSVLKLTNGVGNAKCGVDGLESLQECHFYSVFFPLLFPILVDFCFHIWWILFPRLSRGQFHKCQNFTRTPKATLDRNVTSKSQHYKGHLLGFSSFGVFIFNVLLHCTSLKFLN